MREDIIAKMVAIAEQFNLEAMQGAGMDVSQMMQFASSVRPQLYKVQGSILDSLVSEGLVTINEDA